MLNGEDCVKQGRLENTCSIMFVAPRKEVIKLRELKRIVNLTAITATVMSTFVCMCDRDPATESQKCTEMRY